jgi:hypothetical protein
MVLWETRVASPKRHIVVHSTHHQYVAQLVAFEAGEPAATNLTLYPALHSVGWFAAIATLVGTSTSLESLVVCGEGDHSSRFELLASALRGSTSLKRLRWRADGAISTPPSTEMTEAAPSSTKMTEAGATTLASVLLANTSLEFLSIQRTDWQHRALQAACAARPAPFEVTDESTAVLYTI